MLHNSLSSSLQQTLLWFGTNHFLIERSVRHKRVSLHLLKPAFIDPLTDCLDDSFHCSYDVTSAANKPNDKIVSESEEDSVSERLESYLKLNYLLLSSFDAIVILLLLSTVFGPSCKDIVSRYSKRVFRDKERAIKYLRTMESSTINRNITDIFVD